MSLSQFQAFNWDYNTQSCLLPSLPQGSEIMVSIAYQYGMQAALYSCTPACTFCLGDENHCSQMVRDRSRSSCWRYVSVGLEDGLGVPMAQKSSSCCSGSCCLCHCARDTGTNKINIWPVTWVILTLSSTNTWNPLEVGPEKKRRVEFTFRNCPAKNSSLRSFPMCQQD